MHKKKEKQEKERELDKIYINHIKENNKKKEEVVRSLTQEKRNIFYDIKNENQQKVKIKEENKIREKEENKKYTEEYGKVLESKDNLRMQENRERINKMKKVFENKAYDPIKFVNKSAIIEEQISKKYSKDKVQLEDK
jgi:hypothetical protein